MEDRFFYTADGELLIVPQMGALRFHTELGILEVAPGEICVIPRGVKFRVVLEEKQARGYICENYGLPFRLPELGPDRRQWPGESARLQSAGGGLRRSRRRVPHHREVPGPAVVGIHRSLAAGCGGVARQLCAVQVRSGAVQLHQYAFRSITLIHRSTPC